MVATILKNHYEALKAAPGHPHIGQAYQASTLSHVPACPCCGSHESTAQDAADTAAGALDVSRLTQDEIDEADAATATHHGVEAVRRCYACGKTGHIQANCPYGCRHCKKKPHKGTGMIKHDDDCPNRRQGSGVARARAGIAKGQPPAGFGNRPRLTATNRTNPRSSSPGRPTRPAFMPPSRSLSNRPSNDRSRQSDSRSRQSNTRPASGRQATTSRVNWRDQQRASGSAKEAAEEEAEDNEMVDADTDAETEEAANEAAEHHDDAESRKHTSHVSQEGGESGVELHDRNSRPDTDEDHGHSQYSALFISRQSDSARVSESTLDDKEDDPVRRRHTSLNSNSPPHERARARTRKRKPKRRRMRKRKRNAHRPRGLMLFGVKVLQCKRTVFPRSVYQTNLERRKTTNSKQRTKNVNKSTPNLAVNANNRAKFPTFQLHAQDAAGFMYDCCVRPILTWVLLPCYRLRLKCSKVPPCLTYNHDCRAVVCLCVCVFVP